MKTYAPDPFDASWYGTITPGTEIIARGTRDLCYLTAGSTYIAINGKEDGIFSDRPFVTIKADDGKRHCCHLSRFVPSTHVRKEPNDT